MSRAVASWLFGSVFFLAGCAASPVSSQDEAASSGLNPAADALTVSDEGPVPLPKPAQGAAPEDPSFEGFVARFRSYAIAQGIRPEVYDRAMSQASFDRSTMEAANRQPEFTKSVWDYLASAVSDTRVATGQKLIAQNQVLLQNLQSAYGVDYHILVAIWGLESAYGGFMGNHNLFSSLGTLASEGRRQSFGREQLIAALKIVQSGDKDPAAMESSWAGAMGQTQFIPTTYNGYAVDFDGDGRRDIWASRADALGSAANYLAESGWRSGEPWGFEVTLPAGFDYSLTGMGVRRPVSMWTALGIRRTDGAALSPALAANEASVFLPAGHAGPAFLVLNNFRTILRYNNSTSYALAISLLSERFEGRGQVLAPWPTNDRPLSRSERTELQRLLTAAGFDTQGVDGILGANTKAAVRAYQRSIGAVADGYPSYALLQQLRGS